LKKSAISAILIEGHDSLRLRTMGLMSLFRRVDRTRWFVCSTCMQQTGHDTVKSVFYSEAPPVLVIGRPFAKCPRCGGTNTRSFQEIKNEGSRSALWGLERIVKKHPRSQFEVKPGESSR
jgi:hypothetical protein